MRLLAPSITLEPITRTPTPEGALRTGPHQFRIYTDQGAATLEFEDSNTGRVTRDSGGERLWSTSVRTYARSHPYTPTSNVTPQTITMNQQLQETLATLANTMGTLATSVVTMQTSITTMNERIESLARQTPAAPVLGNVSLDLSGTIEKPAKFKGDGSVIQNANSARAFVASFVTFAQSNSKLSPDSVANTRWIPAFLSFMDGPARDWATPYLEAHVLGTSPWKEWEDCARAFKTRFSVISSEETARDKIEHLKQGSQTLPAYAAEFSAVGALTGYNDVDLMRRFRRGLNPHFSEKLAIRGGRYDTLEALIRAANELYQDLYEETRRHGNGGPRDSHARYTSDVPMEVDAMRPGSNNARFDWLKSMRGRCYGCGSLAHTKAACPVVKPGALCGYCSREGHVQAVCQDKFTGQEKGRGLRITRPTPAPARSTSSAPPRQVNAVVAEPVESREESLARRADALAIQMKELTAAKAQLDKELEGFW